MANEAEEKENGQGENPGPKNEGEAQVANPKQIAEAIQGLLDEGYSAEEIEGIVADAVKAGKLPPEALRLAQQVIDEDSAYADGLFGIERK